MSLNNSQSNLTCSDWYIGAGEMVNFIVYSIFSPFYTIIALIGHCLCLKAFYSKSKQEQAYMYQIFTTVSEIFVAVCWMLELLLFEWLAGYQKEGQIWYRSCYICMRASAMTGVFLITSSFMMSQYFTICMSADRLYALWKPESYRLANAKRNQILALCFCIISPITNSFYQLFVYSVIPANNGTNVDPPLYRLVHNPPNSATHQVFGSLFSSTLAFGLILLYFSNAALVYFYRVRVVKSAKVLNLTSEQKKRQENERTLLLLTVSQCIWMTLSVTLLVTYVCITIFFPSFYICTSSFYRPLLHAFEQFLDLCDLASIFMISKQFRGMIQQGMRCWKGGNVVQPISMPHGQRPAPMP